MCIRARLASPGRAGEALLLGQFVVSYGTIADGIELVVDLLNDIHWEVRLQGHQGSGLSCLVCSGSFESGAQRLLECVFRLRHAPPAMLEELVVQVTPLSFAQENLLVLVASL